MPFSDFPRHASKGGSAMSLKLFILTSISVLLAACTVFGQSGRPPRPGGPTAPPPAQPPGPATPQAPASGLGAPLTGLNAGQLAAFNAGRRDFVANETPASGLGPIFNDSSCVRCHQNPAAGGTNGAPNSSVTRFGRVVNGAFDPMVSLGGSLLQQRSIHPAVMEFVPAAATVRATRITTPVFGAGLIEAIPDATIQALASVPKADGVRGRAATIVDVASGQSRVGRFGWKAQQATLLAFSGDAYLNEMGITNRFFPLENAPNGNTALLAQYNTQVTIVGLQAPVDATGFSKVDRVASFMRFLAPPPASTLTASATAGRALFQQVGCAICHTPTLQTGPNAITALNNQSVRLYSDLLLHNMGSLNDGVAQGNAGPNEMKTAPLWGLRSRPNWLHDGRARSIDAAIRAHDGEAGVSRGRYLALSNAQRQQLLDFLNAL